MPTTDQTPAAALQTIGYTDRAWAIEIECMVPGSADSRAFKTELRRFGFRTTYDGSISPNVQQRGFSGVEIVSDGPMTGQAGRESVVGLCEILARYNVEVNVSCGLHVHIDARDKSWKEIKKLWAAVKTNEDVIYAMLPPSRSSVSWAKKVGMSGEQIDNIKTKEQMYGTWYSYQNGGRGEHVSSQWNNKYNSSRYHGLNLHPWWYQGSVEFRYHSGTTEFEKIWNWILFCQRLTETTTVTGGYYKWARLSAKSQKMHSTFRGRYNDLMRKCGLRWKYATVTDEMKEMESYIKSRIENFTPDAFAR